MRTEQDAIQIIDVILSADELLRAGPTLITMIENAIVSASYSFDDDEDDFDQYESSGEYIEKDFVFASAVKGSTKDLADSILTGDIVSVQELQGLSGLAKRLSSELTELSEGDTYIKLVSQGSSNLENNLDRLLTASNRFFESFDSLEYENKIALDGIIGKGVKVVAKELLKSEDLDSRIPVLISFFEDAESATPPVLEEPGVVEEEVEEPGAEASELEKILQREDKDRAQEEPIGLAAKEFLLESQVYGSITNYISEDTERLLSAYDSFERTNQDEVISLFSPRKTEVKSSPDDAFLVESVDRIKSSVSSPSFTELVYEKIEGLDDDDSFYEDVKSGKKDFFNIDGSIFSGKFADISEALGANIIVSSSNDSAVVEIDEKKLKEIQTIIVREILVISEMSKSVYSSTLFSQAQNKGFSAKDIGAKINLYRRFLVRKFDYLILSIKLRDRAILRFLADQDLLTSNDKDLIKSKCLGSNAFSRNGLFFQRKELYDELVANLVSLYKPASSNNVFKNKKQKQYNKYGISWQDTLDTPFESLLVSEIKGLIEEHLGKKGLNSNKNISKEILSLATVNLLQKLEQMIFYKASIVKLKSKCSVCGKIVYTENRQTKRWDFPKEQYAVMGEQVYSPEKDVFYDIYSLVRDDGSVISLDSLIDSEFEISQEEFDKLIQISKDFGRPDNSVVRVKSWKDIELDFYSGDSFKNIESIIRKSDALRSLGGKLLQSGVKVSVTRSRCPFGGSKDLINKFKKEEAREVRIFVPGEEGLDTEGADAPGYIPTQEDLEKMTVTTVGGDSPWECGFKEDYQQVTGLGLYLEDMVSSNAITNEIKESILNLSRRQSAGGFKFSSRSFVCPTKIAVPSDRKKAEQTIKDYSIIAMPISESEYSETHPIDKMLKADESIVNLYCGARTSISQFDRLEFGKIIKELVQDENEEAYHGIINSMIELGVEVSDILPFTTLKHSHSELGESNIGLDSSAIDDLLVRSNQIARLLKTAMATKTTKIGKGQTSVEKFFDFIKNIKLTCHNNHSFSIDDSMRFVNNNIDLPALKTRFRSNIAKNNVLNKSGLNQLSLLLNIKDGPISTISRNRALEMGMKPYSEFTFRLDPISSIYFENPDDPEGDYLYINSGDAISIYPMKTRFMTSEARPLEAGGTVKTVYLERDVGGMATSSGAIAPPSPEGEARDYFETQAESGDTQVTEREFEQSIAAGERESTIRIQKTNTIIIALIQNAIISIQELLLASTGTSKKDVMFYGTKILKETLEDKINSDFFNQRLTNLLESAFKEYSYLSDDYEISIEEIISSSATFIKDSIANDFGKDPRAFIYAVGTSFNRYLHRKIIEGLILFAQSHPDPDFALEIKDIFLTNKELSLEQVSGTIPSFMDPDEIMEFERSLNIKPKKIVDDISKYISKVEQGAKPKIATVTETWFAKQITIAATAMYLAERLSEFYNKFLSKSSYKYIGYPILKDLDLSTPDNVVATTIDTVLTSGRGALFSLPDILDVVDVEELLSEVVHDLTRLQVGAAYASRSNYYQEKGLAYIKDVYSALADSPDVSSQENAHIKNILERVIANTRSTEVLLAPPDTGKYAEYFSRFENAHSMIPSMSHPVLLVKDKTLGKFVTYKTKTIKPIYLIKQGVSDFSYILGIDTNLIKESSLAILVSKDDEDLIKELLPLQSSDQFSESHPGYFANGWTLMVGNIDKKAIKSAGLDINDNLTDSKTWMSICNHPGTEIALDASGTPRSYKNILLGIDTESGLSLGSYDIPSPRNNYYPPINGFVSTIGVPIPIELSSGASEPDINISLSDMPIDIPADSGDMIRVNISDLLQRNPPNEAESILLSIEKEYADFIVDYENLKKVNEKAAEEKKKQASLTLKSLMNRYRNLPLLVKKSSSSRTSITGNGGFEGSSGYYIPIISPVLANIIVTKACFGAEYAGHGIFGEGLYEDEESLGAAITAVQSFLARLNGYDVLASLFNERDGMINGEPVSGVDLLDPYEMLFSQRMIDGKEVSRINPGYLFGVRSPLRIISRDELKDRLESLKSEEEKVRYVEQQGVVFNEALRRIESIKINDPSEKYKVIYLQSGVLSRWRTHIPSFYVINVGKSDDSNVANFGVPKLVVDTPIYRRDNSARGLDGVRDEAIGSDILNAADLAPLYALRRKTDAGGIYFFSEVLQKFFDKKFDGIKKFIEDYEENLLDRDFQEIDKDAYFDSAGLFNKVSSNIMCSDFIKKSEKYKTDVFGRIMIKSEALMRLFD